MRTKTERGLVNPQCPPEGNFAIDPTSDGHVTLVTEHDGIKQTVTLSPDEADHVGVGLIRLAMIARSAAVYAKKVQIPDMKLAPELHSLLAKANGRT
jgi:hypothetical protein